MNDQRPQTFSDGESWVLELAIRLLAAEDPAAREVLRPKIFVGRLPEDMLVEIPVLEEFSVVGSLVRSEPDPHDDPTRNPTAILPAGARQVDRQTVEDAVE